MSQNLSNTPQNLEFYRKLAKSLLKAVKSSNIDACLRLRIMLPDFVLGHRFLLSDAQWLVAREHGFASWPKLKAHTKLQSINHSSVESGIEPPATTARAPKNRTTTISDEAVLAATGRGWDEWFAALDNAGAQAMSHQAIVKVSRLYFDAGPWWQQMVAVNYEHARGLRIKNQSSDGDFQVNISKTIYASAMVVFNAWAVLDKRAKWLPNAPVAIRKATSPKNLRITWCDSENLDVMITQKGEAKCQISVECSKLSVSEQIEDRRIYWTAALGRLKSMLEAER